MIIKWLEPFFLFIERWANHPIFMPPKPFDPTIASTTLPEAVLPQPEPIVEPKRDLLDEMCQSISAYEGGPKDRNHRNNNAGNCRFFKGGYAPIYGEVKCDPQGFAIFKDWPTGFLYLKNMIRIRAQKNPKQTLQQFMNVYAPRADGNDPIKYATFIATRLNVDKDSFVMGKLIV